MAASENSILLVEDNAILARDEARQLEGAGYRVTCAYRGEQAVEMVRARPGAFDLILMDIDLGPGMDGAQAARRILKERDIPVVFLSSHTEPEVVEKTERITSYGYVVKNTGLTVLAASIKMAFKLHQAYRERRRAEEEIKGHAQHLEALLEIGRTLAASMDLKDALQVMVESATRLAGLDSGAIYLRDDGGLYLGATIPPLPQDFPEAFRRTSLDEHPHVRRAVTTGEPVYMPDARLEILSPAEQAIVEARGLRSILYLPLGTEPRTVGVLILGTSRTPRAFTGNEMELYRALAGQVALMVENSRSRRDEVLHHIREFALESSMSAVGLADMEGRIIYANGAYLRLWGYSRKEEVLGRPITEFAASKEQVEEVVTALRAGGSYSGEGLSRRTDGTDFIVEMSGNLVTSPDGRPLCMMASFIDITARKRAELLQDAVYRIARAAERAEGLADLFKAVHAIIGTVMPARNFYIALFDEGTGLLGFPYFVDEADAPPPPAKPAKGLTEYVLRTGEPLLCDGERDRELRKAGEVDLVGPPAAVWLGVPLRTDGRILGIMAVQHYSDPLAYGPTELRMLEFVSSQVARSIARTRAAEALRESEKRYRLLAENMKDVVWILDPETDRFTYVSPSVEALRGYTAEEVKARPAHEALLPEAAAALAARLPDGIARFLADPGGENSYRNEVPQPRRDGSVVWTDVVTRFFRDEATGKVLVHGVTRDISERKRFEEALHQALRQKEVLMKELQHRVKNSLAVVSGLLALEEEGLSDARSRAVLANTRARIRSIASLYERLYGSSEIDSVDLGSHVRGIAEDLFRTFAPPELRLTARIDRVRLDTKRAVPLGLILNELVMNALKHAYPPGTKGEVRVGLETADGTATLSVADDGAGLPAGFDPASSGGMGLSLARMMTEEIDGALAVESGPEGTRVSVRFKA